MVVMLLLLLGSRSRSRRRSRNGNRREVGHPDLEDGRVGRGGVSSPQKVLSLPLVILRRLPPLPSPLFLDLRLLLLLRLRRRHGLGLSDKSRR